MKAGDIVKAEDALVTLESDKATMDVPAPAAGVVKEVKVKAGDKVSEGSLVLILDAAQARKHPRPHRRPPPPNRHRNPHADPLAASPHPAPHSNPRPQRESG